MTPGRCLPAKALFPPETGRITYCESPYEVARGAEALLLLTEWDEYKHLDLGRLRDLMQVPVLIDGRNFFAPEEAREAGFSYAGMGRRGGTPYVRELTASGRPRPTTPVWTGVEVNLNG